MTQPEVQRPRIRFGPFTADLQAGELWKEGIRVRLQIQPFRVLAALLERPNQLVTRDQLQRTLWPSDTFVDFDQGLNKAVNKLRDVLGDSAEAPRFIETVPRRGYRFVAQVTSDPTPPSVSEPVVSIAPVPARPYDKRRLAALVTVVGTALVVAPGVWMHRSTSSPRKAAHARTTIDPKAQQLYDLGRYYFFRENREDVLFARTKFEEAIDRDPAYALAYAALGDTYDWMALEGYQPLSEVVGQATQAKTKANALNASLAEVHSSLGALEFVKWNWAAAEPEFQKAIQLDPKYFEAHRLYSIYLRTMRRFPEAIQQAKLCDELNPLLTPAKSHLALTYLYAGQDGSAAEQYREILKDHPESSSAHAGLAAALFKLHQDKEAIHELQQALTLEGDDATARPLVYIYERQGSAAARATVLRAELQTLVTLARETYVSPVEFAYRYALLDQREEAFRWLERAYSEHSSQLLNINVDPDYDSLRSDPRFSDLLGRLHLPQ